MKTTDGMLALVIARDAQARLAEGELSDHAEKAKDLNQKQDALRKAKRLITAGLNDNRLEGAELITIQQGADAAGVGSEVRELLGELYATSEAGRSGIAVYENVESAEAYRTTQAEQGQSALSTAVWVDEDSTSTEQQEHAKTVKEIRDALADGLESLKGEATGQELELQMASQEYARASQLASNLLNVRNEVLKSFVQAIRA